VQFVICSIGQGRQSLDLFTSPHISSSKQSTDNIVPSFYRKALVEAFDDHSERMLMSSLLQLACPCIEKKFTEDVNRRWAACAVPII